MNSNKKYQQTLWFLFDIGLFTWGIWTYAMAYWLILFLFSPILFILLFLFFSYPLYWTALYRTYILPTTQFITFAVVVYFLLTYRIFLSPDFLLNETPRPYGRGVSFFGKKQRKHLRVIYTKSYYSEK